MSTSNMSILNLVENSGENFGKQFIQNIKSIYANPKADVINLLNETDDV